MTAPRRLWLVVIVLSWFAADAGPLAPVRLEVSIAGTDGSFWNTQDVGAALPIALVGNAAGDLALVADVDPA